MVGRCRFPICDYVFHFLYYRESCLGRSALTSSQPLHICLSTGARTTAVNLSVFLHVFFYGCLGNLDFFFFLSSGGWGKIKL